MDRILFVEDNHAIVKALLPALSLNHFEVTHRDTLKGGKEAVLKESFSLALLDINLPDGSGLDLCREIHEAFPDLPILILTARLEEQTAIEGFASGAIDYIRKPFSNDELIARIRRSLARFVGKPQTFRFGKLALEAGERSAVYGAEPFELTRRQFDLLLLLVKRAGGIVTRDEILNVLDDEGEVLDRTIDSHMSHLRTKLTKVTNKEVRIRSVYGQGYKLEGE